MSAVRAYSAEPRGFASRSLSLVTGQRLLNKSTAKIVITGAIASVLLGLLLNVLIAQSAYEMANLKAQTRELTTTSEIIQQQVDSLGSNQNLEQAAHDMGMVANTNPVFLSIVSQKVFGKPKRAAYFNSLANNLVANSALTSKTDVTKLLAAQSLNSSKNVFTASNGHFRTGKAMNVAAAKPKAKKVSLPSSVIPGSPTQ